MRSLLLRGLAVLLTAPLGVVWTLVLRKLGFPFDAIAERVASMAAIALSSDAILWTTGAVLSTAFSGFGIWLSGYLWPTPKKRRRKKRAEIAPPVVLGKDQVGPIAPRIAVPKLVSHIGGAVAVLSIAATIWLAIPTKQSDVACRPKVEWIALNLEATDTQLNEPAVVRRASVTRLSRVRYRMIITGYEGGLRNLNAIWPGATVEKIIKRQIEPVGIELVLDDPVGLLLIMITPREMADTKLDIRFECLN